jgi:Mg-chelatase subunit ChlD
MRSRAAVLISVGVVLGGFASCGAPMSSRAGYSPTSSAAPAPSPGGGGGAPAPAPASAGVKAASHDDNLQFNAFLGFIEKSGKIALPCDVSQRIVVSVRDRDGLPLPDAEVAIYQVGARVAQHRTYADGRALLFLSGALQQGRDAKIIVRYKGRTKELSLADAHGHRLEVKLDLQRGSFQSVPLDVAFVLDTTGSMGHEIDRLKKTLDYINFQTTNLSPRPDVRFGMVLFRDRGDDYVTRVIPLTSDVKAFREQLLKVTAGGGGDMPEDVQSALKDTLQTLRWRSDGVKLAFLIGDAPPHLDYGQSYTYVNAMQDAAAKAIKITTVGCSGLDLKGEVVWRQIAQYTMGPYVFLTRGEKGDSEGGTEASVSHHVGSNWIAENLDAIIIRMIKVELAHYSPKGAQPTEDYFAANYSEKRKPEDVLGELFRESSKQLVDYSVQRIADRSPLVVMPVKPAKSGLAATAKRLETRLSVSLSQHREFQLVESGDLSAVIKAQGAQLSDKYDSDKVIKLGKLLPAKLAVLSRVEEVGGAKVELLVKLVRLETGEVLSLSLMKIEKRLLSE